MSNITEQIEKLAEDYADNHAFRVPFDGTNNFYDDKDFKWSKEGFIAGYKAALQNKVSDVSDPAAPDSTANWSKVGDKDKWLDEVRGKESNDTKPEEDLIYRIVENWGNAVHPVSEMVGWLKEYASIVNERKDNADWISVEDRLPDDDETVLIFDGNNVYVGGYGYVLSRRKKDKKKWYMHNQDWDGMSAESKVTHWMPLPAPPVPKIK